MGQQHYSRRLEPSWPAVAATTVRLWLQRHTVGGKRPASRRQRGMLVLSAVAAMALGAVVTLAFTRLAFTREASRAPTVRPSDAAQSTTPGQPGQLQVAEANRHQAAAWIATQVLPGTDIECDAVMCAALQAAGVPAGNMLVATGITQDPLNSTVVAATPALRNQFGPRLDSVYAPLLLAQFGTGPERIEIRFVAPDGTAAFEKSLAPDRADRIGWGSQLLANKHVQVSASARSALLAGNVDPRLLITLSALAGELPVRLVAFDDASPGAAVPLRGAELGASAPAGLSAIQAFLAAQRSPYKPSQVGKVEIAGGQSVVTVQYDAPGWLGLSGP
jgi:hypothetical protein